MCFYYASFVKWSKHQKQRMDFQISGEVAVKLERNASRHLWLLTVGLQQLACGFLRNHDNILCWHSIDKLPRWVLSCVPDLRDLAASQPAWTTGYSLELCWNWNDWNHIASAETLFSAVHITDSARSPGRYDRAMRCRKMTQLSTDMKQFWMSEMSNAFVSCEQGLEQAVEVGGRHWEGVSVDKHWRGRGSCGGCASSKLPSQKTILFFFIQKFSQWNAHRLKYRYNLPTRNRSNLCVVLLVAAIWQIHQLMRRAVWKLSFMWGFKRFLQDSLSTLQDPLLFIYFLYSFSYRNFPLSPSYLLLVSAPLPSVTFPPPPPPKIRPSSVQFSLARIQRGPGYPSALPHNPK